MSIALTVCFCQFGLQSGSYISDGYTNPPHRKRSVRCQQDTLSAFAIPGRILTSKKGGLGTEFGGSEPDQKPDNIYVKNLGEYFGLNWSPMNGKTEQWLDEHYEEKFGMLIGNKGNGTIRQINE